MVAPFTPKIPLEKRLRKRLHAEVGRLQDEVVEVLYSLGTFVLHGGTAVWRCYGGNRFSEDLDLYGRIDVETLKEALRARALTVLKLKETENLIFGKVSSGHAEVRIEINKAVEKTPTVKAYERMDGSYMDIYTLSPEELVKEKIRAYLSRRFVRDLYDIYHLLHRPGVAERVRDELEVFLEKVQRPVDEGILKSLVYSGVAPSFQTMLSYIKGVVEHGSG